MHTKSDYRHKASGKRLKGIMLQRYKGLAAVIFRSFVAVAVVRIFAGTKIRAYKGMIFHALTFAQIQVLL